MSKNSNKISEKLKKILNTNALDKENILPVMSNDELGDLSYYYNKIQEKLRKKPRAVTETNKVKTNKTVKQKKEMQVKIPNKIDELDDDERKKIIDTINKLRR